MRVVNTQVYISYIIIVIDSFIVKELYRTQSKLLKVDI